MARSKTLDEILSPYDENITVAPHMGRTKAQIIEHAKEYKEALTRRIKEDPEFEIDEYVQRYLTAKTDEDFYKLETYEDGQYDKDGNEITINNPNGKMVQKQP